MSKVVRMGFLKVVLVVVVIVAFDLHDVLGSLRSSHSPRSMGPKSDPASRSPALSPLGLWNPLQVASQFQSPLGPDSKSLAHEPFGLQEKQLLEGPVKPLDWRYPIVPEVQRELAVDFQLREPVTPCSVTVQCGENRVLVEVQQDFFSNGQLIQPTGLSLGGCPVVGPDPGSRVLLFEYELQDCNGVLMMNEDELVYTFSLTYTPEAFAGTPITRANGAIVGVQCHYQRLQNVSSDALRPTWVPYASTEAGGEVLLFSLKIMMEDWSYQRPSYSYFLGGVINIEASVKQYNHVPLRVFVDSCVATQVPDVNSLPRYSFIENHGCFVDAKTTASSSRFMPRSQVDKIQFQLEAFMFQEGKSPSIYITCILKATLASAPSDTQRKSCSFANGWLAADGNDQVCGCCDSTCGPDGEFPAPYGESTILSLLSCALLASAFVLLVLLPLAPPHRGHPLLNSALVCPQGLSQRQLFHRDGHHPNKLGSRVLKDNIYFSLNHPSAVCANPLNQNGTHTPGHSMNDHRTSLQNGHDVDISHKDNDNTTEPQQPLLTDTISAEPCPQSSPQTDILELLQDSAPKDDFLENSQGSQDSISQPPITPEQQPLSPDTFSLSPATPLLCFSQKMEELVHAGTRLSHSFAASPQISTKKRRAPLPPKPAGPAHPPPASVRALRPLPQRQGPHPPPSARGEPKTTDTSSQ
ncbi:unnamed protein product [Leuciscus chuanchicus]